MIQTRKARNVRRRAVEYMDYLTRRAAALAYEEFRPMRSYPTPFLHVFANKTDCSESSAVILEAAGAPPVFKVGNLCYTGTFMRFCPNIGKLFTRRGDAVVICTAEWPEGAHMVLLKQGGLFHRDPIVWSHGGDGVDEMPLSQMLRGFDHTHVAYCRTVPLRF